MQNFTTLDYTAADVEELGKGKAADVVEMSSWDKDETESIEQKNC